MEGLISKTLAEYEKKYWPMLQLKGTDLVILISPVVFHSLDPSYDLATGSLPPYLMFYQGYQVFIDYSIEGEKWGFAVRIDGLIFHKEYYTNNLPS
jgi:hypothetical protein